MSDFDELDELLGLMDEDDETHEKKEKEKEKQIATQQKNKDNSESFVCASLHCKLRIDPLTRTISSEDLQLRLRRWTFVSLTNLPLKLHTKSVTNGEFVIIGILSSKIIRHSKNNNKYLLIKIDDFYASISCFIFNAEIIEKFYKIQPGTILVLAGPQILNDKKQTNNHNNNHNNNNNNNISLKIESNEQILVIGKSVDFSFCNSILNPYAYDQNSKCKNVINKSKSTLCVFHKTKQYKKYASRRSDANKGTINLRSKNRKKALSGSGSGSISMIQTRKKHTTKKRVMSSVSYKENRKKTANLLMASSAVTPFMKYRMSKYSNGNKTMLQIEKNAKKKERNKLLAGKPLIPHLGTNWNDKTQNSNDLNIILKPKKNRKRSFQSMMNNSLDSEQPNNKKSRLTNMVNVCNGMNEKENINDSESDEKLQVDEITSVQVRIFICKFRKCPLKDKLTEKANSFCKSHSMNVVKIMGRKYFWKCGVCNNKIHTLNTKRIKSKCRKCGADQFKASSAYNISNAKTS